MGTGGLGWCAVAEVCLAYALADVTLAGDSAGPGRAAATGGGSGDSRLRGPRGAVCHREEKE